MGVRCPYCEGESSVIDSRASIDGVRRRRECPECKRRFTTYEKPSEPNLKVSKRSGKNEPFSSDKLIAALGRVCRDRPNVDQATIDRLARAIEAQLVDERARTVSSGRLAEMVLSRLIEIDKISYERLAINYIAEDGQLRPRGSSASTQDPGQLGLFEKNDGDG